MNIESKQIGQRIKEATKAAGFSQRKLAEKLGVTDSAVSAWMNGDARMSEEGYAFVSELTGKSIDYFITGRDAGSPKAMVADQPEIYSPGGKSIAAACEIKMKGQTPQEQLEFIQNIMEAIWKR
ncbi:MAG: helix-turn-helix transcriptional regulator [Desulfuromonadaceae bacterium]|nr:helix-turn-helix transcriptional regulator [Desulfuromonadaceae bacterium]MDD2856470.1 helix-turn-helix transcriptional regulator [Desulfuromonadaceae bacterium]